MDGSMKETFFKDMAQIGGQELLLKQRGEDRGGPTALHLAFRVIGYDIKITVETIRHMMEIGGEKFIHATDAANCNILHYACMDI